ncbi:sugar transferase [Pedobacter deserti]|uniref:sugar transferase n=1 Tax=Pedobacter deserti TaxID=2817382 RepID=UPI002109E29B|nr:sugar transferase [Pedobacter sp. SYSU D00382]
MKELYRFIFKRILDLVVTALVLVILLPVLICVFFSLLFVTKGTPIFVQKRPGKHGRIFKIIKFKTMNDKKDANGNMLPDEERLTSIGAFIRRTSLDEIPQLINVLKGDMSLIGPRPLLPEYLSLYSPEQARRHNVRPGITGWAQVNGRNAISWNQKFELDVYYVDNLTFWLDLKILSLTVKKVILKEGISSGNSVTMERFTGN